MKKKVEEEYVEPKEVESEPKPALFPITVDFGSEGLNQLRDTVNEIIKRV